VDTPAGAAYPAVAASPVEAAATAASAAVVVASATAASVSLACTSKATTANCHLTFARRLEQRCN
jgi:hypothetical protein